MTARESFGRNLFGNQVQINIVPSFGKIAGYEVDTKPNRYESKVQQHQGVCQIETSLVCHKNECHEEYEGQGHET